MLSNCVGIFLSVVCGLAAPEASSTTAAEPFKIRGLLPWHNFLSGPSAYNFDDWKLYLDDMHHMNLNLLMLHAYQGGSGRYADYVEPHIWSSYRNIVPRAGYDTSSGPSRWGFSPLPVDSFAFNTSKLYGGAKAFGSDCAIKDATQGVDGSQIQCAQDLIRQVFQYAHQLGIKVCLGFEFGVWPPEYYSVEPSGMMENPYLPDPFSPASSFIMESFITNLLSDYPGLDYITFWMEENPTMYIGAGSFPILSPAFKEFNASAYANFSYLEDEQLRFSGVWCLAHLTRALGILERMKAKAKPVLSGWGGEIQLTPLLAGLHSALPKHLIFTVLNPAGGADPTPGAIPQISKEGREVWVVPWLEYDGSLWHPQPHVANLRAQVQAASVAQIPGVLALHWRGRNGTDIPFNFEAYRQLVNMPSGMNVTVSAVYNELSTKWFGKTAASVVAPLLQRAEELDLFVSSSAEFEPYSPSAFGMIKNVSRLRDLRNALLAAKSLASSTAQRQNLDVMAATADFVILLSRVSKSLQIADEIRTEVVSPLCQPSPSTLGTTCSKARAALQAAPLAALFEAYARRTRTRGELGVLSALNQKLWVFATELRQWTESFCRSSAEFI